MFDEVRILFHFNFPLLTPVLNESFQRHALAALYPVKAPLAPIEQEAGWAPEPVWGFSGLEMNPVLKTARDTGQ